MSFARFASTVSPLAYRPPPTPKPTPPEAKYGVIFGRRYRLTGHPSYTFIPERFHGGDTTMVVGDATDYSGMVVRNVNWFINRMELIEES